LRERAKKFVYTLAVDFSGKNGYNEGYELNQRRAPP
jgi:hypothetical protein